MRHTKVTFVFTLILVLILSFPAQGGMASGPLEPRAYLPLVSGPRGPSLWFQVTSPVTVTLNDVFMVSKADGWIVGDGGTILRWNGAQWLAAASPTASNLKAVTMLSETDGWAVGDNGVILRWSGSAWEPYSSPVTTRLNDVQMLAPNNGFVVGNNGVILQWNGTNWASINSPTSMELDAIKILSPTDGWALGGDWDTSINWYKSEILHWNGSTWSKFDHVNGLDPLYAVDFVSPTNGWAVGYNNLMMRYNGTTWYSSRPTSPFAGHFLDVDVLAADDIWSVGFSYNKGTIYHWNGSAWAYVDNPLPKIGLTLYSVFMITPYEGWAVGQSGAIVHYRPN